MNWGYSITFSFIAFGLFIGYMAVVSFQQSIDLVAEDYYQQEIAYQDHIDKVENTQGLSEKIVVKQYQNHLSITFPEAVKNISGQVVLFRPSDASLDKTFAVKPDAQNTQMIPTAILEKGMYKLKVDWNNGIKEFYTEETIFIR